MLSTSVSRPAQLITRVLQWSSAVIVMGITSYFIHVGPRGQHLIYQEVIVCPLLDIPSCLDTDQIVLPVGRLLPTRLHLPVHANVPEQIRPRHRRHLLIPVCFSLSAYNPVQANRTKAGSQPSSSPRKTTTSRTATSTRPPSSTAARRRLTRLLSSWLCMSSPLIALLWNCGNDS